MFGKETFSFQKLIMQCDVKCEKSVTSFFLKCDVICISNKVENLDIQER